MNSFDAALMRLDDEWSLLSARVRGRSLARLVAWVPHPCVLMHAVCAVTGLIRVSEARIRQDDCV